MAGLRMRRARRRFGVAAVEAAIMLPFVLYLMLGLWEVGRMVWVTTILTNSVREGARVAAGGLSGGQGVTVAMVQQQVKDYLTSSGFPSTAVNGATITLTNLSSHNWTDPGDAWP